LTYQAAAVTLGAYVRAKEGEVELLKQVEKAGDEWIAAIRAAQDLTISLAEAVVSPIARRVPDLAVPDALRLPRPRAVAEAAFALSERFAQSQKDFALRLLEAFDPAKSETKAA
jgi:hypothetical protein